MFGQLALLVAAGLLGPLLAAGRRPLAPVLVGELIAGILLGKTGLDVLDPATAPLPAHQRAAVRQVSGVNVSVESTTPRVPATLQSFRPALVPGGGAASGRRSSDPSASRAK